MRFALKWAIRNPGIRTFTDGKWRRKRSPISFDARCVPTPSAEVTGKEWQAAILGMRRSFFTMQAARHLLSSQQLNFSFEQAGVIHEQTRSLANRIQPVA